MVAWGLHFSIGGNKTGSGQFIQRLNAAGIPVMLKGVGDAGLCYEAQESGRQHGVNNVIVYRMTNNSEYQYDTPRYDLAPSEAARLHFDKTAVKWPSELDRAVCWMEPINEPRAKLEANETTQTWGGMHPVAWLGRFMVEYANIAKASGFKVCGPSFASGDPEVDLWQLDGMADWLRYCADNPATAAISYHEYNYGAVSYADNYPWHYGRFQSVIAAADKLGIPRTFGIFITEFGWKYDWVPTWEQAVPALAEYNALCARFPMVKGIALWTLQDGWGGISDRLAQWIAADGNPFANWIINNQLEPLGQPQPTAPEFGATLPAQPPDGGETMTTYKWKSTIHTSRPLPDGATHIRYSQYAADGTHIKSTRVPIEADAKEMRVVAEVEEETENPNPPQQKPYLEVDALGQRDPAWANVTLGQPTGHGKTIGNWGCLLVAYNSLARFWGLTTRLPDAENAHYVSAGAFSAQFIKPAALRTAYPNSVAYDGYLTRESDAMRSKIRQWVDDGWPVPCRVDFNPATGQWEQHWVLVVGYIGDTDFYMMDPWHGDIAIVNDRYAIPGSDILEAIFYRPEETTTPPTPPPGQAVNMTQYYLPPNGRTYGDISIKSTNWGQGDVRQQLQLHGGYCYVTKGGEIEKRMILDGRIYFLLDDSPGDGKYYTVNSPTGWIPVQWAVGQTFVRQETTTFYYKANCQQTGEISTWTNQMLFKALYPEWASPHGIKLQNVAHLQWLVNGVVEEDYWLAPGLGYAGWKNRHGRESWVRELIPYTDQQPNKFVGACYHDPVG